MSVLYQHQIEGAQWLAARTRGYNADVPGLGKTRTALAALDEDATPLVVCPAIVRTHWKREATLLNVDNVIVKSYDEITRGGVALMKHVIGDVNVTDLILDEAHYLKHASSQRTKILLGRDGYARRMKRVYALSGTPIPKNPGEFWTILSSLFPEVALEHKLKSYSDFRDRFCTVRSAYIRGALVLKVLPEVRNEAEFKEILGKVMLRRTLDDVGLDVPELDWQITRVDGRGESFNDDPDGADVYVGLRLNAGDSLADIANDPHVARMRRRLGELKVAPVTEMLCQMLEDSDEKIVVFAHHRSVLLELRGNLSRFGVCYIDGDTSPAKRDELIDLFQNHPRDRVFLGQNIACQTGVTLTAARRVVLVEPDWTAVVNHQLGHRVARIGQKAEHCIAHMIALAGTLDEAIISQNHKEVRMSAAIGLGAT